MFSLFESGDALTFTEHTHAHMHASTHARTLLCVTQWVYSLLHFKWTEERKQALDVCVIITEIIITFQAAVMIKSFANKGGREGVRDLSYFQCVCATVLREGMCINESKREISLF